MSDWLAAVCEIAPGTETISSPRFVMPMAVGDITRCSSKPAVAGNYYAIVAGYYDSEQSADLDLPGTTGAPLGAYARGWDPSTQKVVMIALLRSTHPAKALAPLARFGFSLQPNASRTASSGSPLLPSVARPEADKTLPASASGYVYIETQSGKTRCQLSLDRVGCASKFTSSPVIDGERATGVEVSADGSHRWVLGNLDSMPAARIGYDTYSAVGWTISADRNGTRFTNAATGHGMFVRAEKVDFF